MQSRSLVCVKYFDTFDDIICMIECRIVIQEHLENGANYFHNFPLDVHFVDEAFEFMKQEYHSDCIFIIEYSLN